MKKSLPEKLAALDRVRNAMLLDINDVMEIFDIRSRMTVYDWVSQGRLPPPVKKCRWKIADIEAAIRSEGK